MSGMWTINHIKIDDRFGVNDFKTPDTLSVDHKLEFLALQRNHYHDWAVMNIQNCEMPYYIIITTSIYFILFLFGSLFIA